MVKSICHVILEPRYSGAEILVLGLVRRQLQARVASSIVAMRPCQAAFQHELSELEKLGCKMAIPDRFLDRRERIQWIRRAVRRDPPCIIFAHALTPTFYARLACIGTSVPLVSVLHAADDYKERKARYIEKLIWPLNSALIGVCPTSLENYSSRVGGRIRSELIPNGIDISKYAVPPTRRDALRRELFGQRHDQEIVILQVGRTLQIKQQHLTAEAVGRVHDANPQLPIRLVFAGLTEDCEYLARVREVSREYNLEGRMHVLGDRRDIPDLLAAADVYVMPSFREAHSIAALEALASGVYCVFSDIDAFEPFATLEGVTVADCAASNFTRVLNNIITSRSYATRYSRQMNRFGMEECASRYFQLADELCSCN